MAIPLRVVQWYRVDDQGEMEFTAYTLQVKTGEGWKDVPVVIAKEGDAAPE